MRIPQVAISVLALLLCGCGGGGKSDPIGPSTFKILQSPSDTTSASDISNDGRTISGSGINPQGAIYWIDDAPGVLVASQQADFFGSSISPDGQVLVGTSQGRPATARIGGNLQTFPILEGFDSATGRDFGGGTLLAEAFRSPGTQQPYIVRDGISRILPDIGSNTVTLASRISDSGTVVVGLSNDRPVRWTNLTNPSPEALTDASGVAEDVSSNGQVIVGHFTSGSRFIAFRWTAATGVTDIGQSSENGSMDATAVNSDGSVIVGNAYSAAFIDNTGRPFIWTAKSGVRLIENLPGFTSPPFSGLTNLNVTGVSGDGRVVVGTGMTSGGIAKDVAWVVRLGSL